MLNLSKNIGCLIIIFMLGLLFMMTNEPKPYREGFNLERQCPNILVQKGKHIVLGKFPISKNSGR